MAKPRRMLWYAVDVDARQNEKVVELPSDTARYGWFLAVLAEAKRQKRQGQFRSRAHLGELIGRFNRFIPHYRSAGLLEEAPKLCVRCKGDFGDLPAGALVVHDWWQKQRDPLRAERAEAWRAEHPSNDDQTPIERPLNATPGPDEGRQQRSNSVRSGATPPRARDVRAQGRESTVDSRASSGEEAPSSAREPTANGAPAGASSANLIGLERADVAALRRRRWRTLSAEQLAMLDEIAWRQCDGDPELQPIALESGRQWSAGVILAAPKGAKLLEHLIGHESRIRAKRQAAADAEADARRTPKRGEAGPLAAEHADRMTPAQPTNGAPRMSRDEERDYLLSVEETLEGKHFDALLARRGWTRDELHTDDVDFTQPPEEQPHA